MKFCIALLSLTLAFEAAAFELQLQIPGQFSNLLSLIGYDDLLDESHKHEEPPGVSSNALVQTTGISYWLEDIQHRGVSAFNPDPSYQVFRNVKDFGAKGYVLKSLPPKQLGSIKAHPSPEMGWRMIQRPSSRLSAVGGVVLQEDASHQPSRLLWCIFPPALT